MNASYSDTTVRASRAMRLGLRVRLRAAWEARMASPSARRRLAENIEHAVDRAASPRTPFTAAVPVAREAAGLARGALLDLAERLRAPRPVNADGVRLVRRLLIDGAGPLYAPAEPGDLRAAALRALGALDGRGDTD